MSSPFYIISWLFTYCSPNIFVERELTIDNSSTPPEFLPNRNIPPPLRTSRLTYIPTSFSLNSPLKSPRTKIEPVGSRQGVQ